MYERLFKNRDGVTELKVRQYVAEGAVQSVQYDRIGLTGTHHDHEYVKVRPLEGIVTEGVRLGGCTGNPANCPACGGGH